MTPVRDTHRETWLATLATLATLASIGVLAGCSTGPAWTGSGDSSGEPRTYEVVVGSGTSPADVETDVLDTLSGDQGTYAVTVRCEGGSAVASGEISFPGTDGRAYDSSVDFPSVSC